EVQFGEHALRLVSRQPLEQAPGPLGVLRVAGDAGTADVDVYAAAFLVGPEEAYRQFGMIDQLAAEIVSIHQSHIALSGCNRVDHQGVAAEDRRRQVGDPALDQLLSSLKAKAFYHRAHQRHVVDLLRGAQTET